MTRDPVSVKSKSTQYIVVIMSLQVLCDTDEIALYTQGSGKCNMTVSEISFHHGGPRRAAVRENSHLHCPVKLSHAHSFKFIDSCNSWSQPKSNFQFCGIWTTQLNINVLDIGRSSLNKPLSSIPLSAIL